MRDGKRELSVQQKCPMTAAMPLFMEDSWQLKYEDKCEGKEPEWSTERRRYESTHTRIQIHKHTEQTQALPLRAIYKVPLKLVTR